MPANGSALLTGQSPAAARAAPARAERVLPGAKRCEAPDIVGVHHVHMRRMWPGIAGAVGPPGGGDSVGRIAHRAVAEMAGCCYSVALDVLLEATAAVQDRSLERPVQAM